MTCANDPCPTCDVRTAYLCGQRYAVSAEQAQAHIASAGQSVRADLSPRSRRQMLVVVAGGYRAIGSPAGDSVIAFALPD